MKERDLHMIQGAFDIQKNSPSSATRSDLDVAVILPCYNEAVAIGETVRQFRAALPDATMISVGQFESVPEPGTPFDAWLVTEPAPRDDPCAVFQR